jgi:hypothetical protein
MRDFAEWFSHFRESISDYAYYVDFAKVHKNVDAIKVELNILNSLIGSQNIEAGFDALVTKYPDTLKCVPLLLAIRASEIYAIDGRRLNPRKKDLQEWRECFAARLREQGIAANATPRRARGVTQKAQKQVVRHVDARRAGRGDTPSRVTAGQAEDVARALAGQAHENPAAETIKRNRQETIHAYGQIARLLAQSDDPATRKTAQDILKFVQTMPDGKTLHEERLAAARRVDGGGILHSKAGKGRAQAPGRARDATLGKAHAPAQEK